MYSPKGIELLKTFFKESTSASFGAITKTSFQSFGGSAMPSEESMFLFQYNTQGSTKNGIANVPFLGEINISPPSIKVFLKSRSGSNLGNIGPNLSKCVSRR